MTRSRRFVDWAVRHGMALWVIAFILGVPAFARTAWLYAHLRSELEELLPRESPSVIALASLKRRLGLHKYLGVVVDAGSREELPAAESFLDALADRARSYPSGFVSAVRTGNEAEVEFLKTHGALYLDRGDLETLRARVEAKRDYEVARASGTLLDETEPSPVVDVKDIRERYEKRLGRSSSGATARYTSPDEPWTVLLLELGDGGASAAGARAVVNRVKADVEELRTARPSIHGMRIGYAGDAAIATEELSALVADLSWSSAIVVVAVILAIVLYYRWWRSVLVLLPPLLLATFYSFGLASLPPFNVAAVNSNTAFLASIIVGNGINFGLVLLGRYVEERRAGTAVHESIARAVEGSRDGTLAAASAAAASYAALAVTKFQGFRQFGFIGGLGMSLAWITSFVLMPSLLTWLDRGEETRPKTIPLRGRFTFWVARGVAYAPRAIVAFSVIATFVAAMAVAKWRTADLESDFSRLRRRDTWTEGEGFWGRRMDEVLGEYLTPLVVLTSSTEDAEAVARALRQRMGEEPFRGRITSIRTINDVLPSEQPEKLALLAALRKDLTPRLRAELSANSRDYVNTLFREGADKKIALDDLPRTFTLGLRERDGTVGNIVLVYPAPGKGWWDAAAMATFVGALRDLAKEAVYTHVSMPPEIAGSIPLSSDIVGAIRHDGPLASAAAFLCVVVMVTLMLRSPAMIAYVVLSLVVGVCWMAGASHLLGIRLNFANFIAFPITFGVGVDYAVNVMSRYQHDGRRDILAVVQTTGAAVALCSLTTIIGYSSLLLAQNQALFLFGLVAVLGEVSCLTVALVSLPAWVLTLRLWRSRPRSRSGKGAVHDAVAG